MSKFKIKFGDIKIGNIAKNHLIDCCNKNNVTYGEKTKLLETKWANLFGTKFSVGVNSGSSANLAALLSLYNYGAKPGDIVIVPGLSFIATASSVVFAGFKPLYCDIKEDLTINEKELLRIIDNYKRYKGNIENIIAIMPVTLMGNPYNAKIIREICDDNNFHLITDNCEGAGCKYDGKFIEEYSDMSTMSFYAAHLCFSCQHGQISTNNEKLYSTLLSVRSHGRKPNSLYFEHDLLGTNMMPTDIHSCIGLEQIDKFWETFKIRKDNWFYLRSSLDKYSSIFSFADVCEFGISSPHAFSMTLRQNHNYKFQIKDFSLFLENNGIETKRNFGAMYQHKALKAYGYNKECPIAEWVGNNGIHIGCHQNITSEQNEYIVKIIDNFFDNYQ